MYPLPAGVGHLIGWALFLNYCFPSVGYFRLIAAGFVFPVLLIAFRIRVRFFVLHEFPVATCQRDF